MRSLVIACSLLVGCWRGDPVQPAPPVEAGERTPARTPERDDEPKDEAARLVGEADRAFERIDMVKAEELYRKALAYPTAKVYDYARYKLGWVHYNGSRFQEALEIFAQLGMRATDETLRKVAGDDAAGVYARVGKPHLARAFFERLDATRVAPRLERLADAYAMDGKYAEETVVRAQITP